MIPELKNKAKEWLLWSQYYTKIDMVYFGAGGFWSTLPYIISTVLSMGLIIAFANLLPKEIYGTYKYILSVAGILSFLTLTGMNTALTRAVAQGQKGLLRWSIKKQLKFNSIYFFACFIVAGYYWFHSNNVLAIGLTIMGITFPINTALTSYGAYLAGKKNFKRASHYSIISSIFSTLTLLSSLFLTDKINLLVAAYSTGVLLPSLFFYFKTAQEDNDNTASELQKNEVLKYSAHLTIVPIVSVVSQYIDKMILFQSIGAIELAIYSLAQAIPERLKGLAKSGSAILLPRLAERSLEDIRPSFYQRLFLSALPGAVIFIIYWFIAPYIFSYLLPGYLDSIKYSRVLMIGPIFSIPFNYIGAVFRSQKMLRAIYLSSFIARTPTIFLYFILGLTWGLWGMVIANVSGLALTVIWTVVIWEIEYRKLSRKCRLS